MANREGKKQMYQPTLIHGGWTIVSGSMVMQYHSAVSAVPKDS